ncbi:MAG: SUMF1/EgtB/PvdO family nonheme iron enzyme [Chloroflexi bacterium]|nr:SUMF1/EgtB/PvdO family nonheme iron enzyme [Chloroflexota bacterium]
MECTRCKKQLPDGLPDDILFCPYCRAPLSGAPDGPSIAITQEIDTVQDNAAVLASLEGEHAQVGGERWYVNQQPAGDRPEDLRHGYLGHVLKTTSHLSLTGIDPKAASESKTSLNLSAVYTALLTLTPEAHGRMLRGDLPDRDREMRRLSALEQLNRHPRLVLLGEPGSGKSTFVDFVAMCLAGEGLGRKEANLALLTAPLPDDEGADQEEPQPWTHGALLPVRVVLRDFAARGLPDVGKKAAARHLWDFIASELESAELGDYAPHLKQELRAKGGLILLDGLDEVPEAGQRREQIKDVVEDFVATFSRCRVLVTSRTYAYQRQDWKLSGFAQEVVLAPFSAGQIHRFVDHWYAHIGALRNMASGDAQGRAELLKRAINGSDRLQSLAERPLLLTLMASLHAWRGGSLPERREELYADTVDLLLDWWESQRVVRDAAGNIIQVMQPSLAEWLRVDRAKVRHLLNELAYQAHAKQQNVVGTADVPEGDLLSGLMRLSQNPEVHNNPALLVRYLSQRAGLLLPRGVGVYTFPHRTFQEYLAACHLTDYEYPDQVAELARADPNRWREVALLAGAKAARGAAAAAWYLAEALCFQNLPAGTPQAEADAWGALLAGQVLVESANLERVSERNVGKVGCVKTHLARILETGNLPAVERVAAGRALTKLGDPRPGVGLRPDGLPDIVRCKVPEGPFLMGSDKYHGDEQPQHKVTLPTYQISKYPVTNVQFSAFAAAGGYQERRYWTRAGWKWRNEYNITSPRAHRYGEPYDLPNHPVVGVTWYEAVAYCRWLSDALGVDARLPSEAEWEKAARGEDGRVYPWGDEADPNHANYDDTGIGTTSAVGCFPGGASPYSVLDMAGNIWEWCTTKWESNYENYSGDGDPEGTDPRVVRGGAFNDFDSHVRCAFRFRGSTFLVNSSYGFRVVVVPISRSAL